MEVLDPAAGAADGLAVVGEEVEPLLRVDHQLITGSALNRKNSNNRTFIFNKSSLSPTFLPKYETVLKNEAILQLITVY